MMGKKYVSKFMQGNLRNSMIVNMTKIDFATGSEN